MAPAAACHQPRLSCGSWVGSPSAALSWGRWDLALWPVVSAVWSNKPSSWLKVAGEQPKVKCMAPDVASERASGCHQRPAHSRACLPLCCRASVRVVGCPSWCETVLGSEEELEPESPDSSLDTNCLPGATEPCHGCRGPDLELRHMAQRLQPQPQRCPVHGPSARTRWQVTPACACGFPLFVFPPCLGFGSA